ncbi:MAG: KUP/HAK/KT family potassium transporter [Candidatus Babeliales bacterium]|jgi:KUP system potassium uptake protein
MTDSYLPITRPSSAPKQIKDIIKALGIVFGDIGTSPIYTLPAIFYLIRPSIENVIGVVSLIIWTLGLLVCIEYSWLAMSLSKKGEGGTIVLREILKSLLKSKSKVTLITFLSFIGISLFIGDGVITPAISILSAVEGLRYIPGLEYLKTATLVAVACLITFGLFMFQRKGVDAVSRTFGPIMVVWFLAILGSGFLAIIQYPFILNALNPYYGIKFVVTSGWVGFFILSGIILCATGVEALYADMGHLGRKPIQQAWGYVFIALIFTYLGQGAYLIQNPNSKIIIYEMFLGQVSWLYVPFLILSLMATVIASQAMISGIFSVIYQGITTQIMPMFKIEYTSSRMHSQVYIGFINWTLLCAVLFMIINFKESLNLAAAYGFAASGTMVITGIMMTSIFWLRKNKFKRILAGFLVSINVIFFASTLFKVKHGGYWSILIALIPLSIILIYVLGQAKVRSALQPVSLENFINIFSQAYSSTGRLCGTALFFVRDTQAISPYVHQAMFENGIIYEDNILVSVIQRDDPYGIIGFFKGEISSGLRIFEIHCGYMEVLNVENVLKNAGINAKVIFYGLDEIVTKNIFMRIFSAIKRLSPSFVQFHELPRNKLHGVVTVVHV